MGLDVILHERVLKVDQCMDDGNCFLAHVIDSSFEKNISKLHKNSWYISDKRSRVFGYAYGFHADFRSFLCTLIGKEGNYWRDYHNESDSFHELLYFAGNEGCIDWVTSNKLYNDFEAYKKEVGNSMYKETYYDWLRLFEVARKEGNVIEFS